MAISSTDLLEIPYKAYGLWGYADMPPKYGLIWYSNVQYLYFRVLQFPLILDRRLSLAGILVFLSQTSVSVTQLIITDIYICMEENPHVSFD